MKNQQKGSLFNLQQQIKEELLKMPSTSSKRKSLDLRHTLGGNPEHQIIKSALKKMQSLNNFDLDSSRKRQASLTSTRLPEPSKSINPGNRQQEQRFKEKVVFKMEEKGKLKKKISKQESPQPFMKLKRGETLPAQLSPTHYETIRQRRQFNSPTSPIKRTQPLTPEQYEQIIQKQKLMIDRLQKIIETLGQD